MPTVLKSGNFNLLETSGPLIGLYGDCFTVTLNYVKVCKNVMRLCSVQGGNHHPTRIKAKRILGLATPSKQKVNKDLIVLGLRSESVFRSFTDIPLT